MVPAVDLLNSKTEMVQYMAARLLSNLSDNGDQSYIHIHFRKANRDDTLENNQKEIGKVGGVAALINLLRVTEFSNVKTEAMNALAALTENGN